MQSIPLHTKKALFNKGQQEPLTPDEQALWEEIVEWENPENARVDPDGPLFRDALKLYVELKKGDDDSWEKLQQVILQDTQAAAIPNRVKIPAGVWKTLIALAAASIVLIVGYYLWSHKKWEQPELATTETATDKVRIITLPDSSVVWLNKGSSIRYPATFAGRERRVELTGEAYFIVSHDASKQFLVAAGNTEITDLGTEFDVNSNTKAVITTVKTGKVSVRVAGGTKDIDPGQQAIVKVNSIQVLQANNIDSTLQWKTQFIKLKGKTTEAVMEQIHNYYNVPCSIEPGLPPLDLSSEISVENSLDSTIRSLDDAAENISFRYRGGKVMVTRK